MELTKQLKAHQEWLKDNKKGQQLNLSGSSLFGQDLTSHDLSGAILDNCDMTNCVLTKCLMRGTSLKGTTLVGAKMANVDLSGANLTDATCRGTILQRANFEGAILRSCDFFGADLRQSSLDKASDINNANFQKALLDQQIIARTEPVQEAIAQPSEGPVIKPGKDVPSVNSAPAKKGGKKKAGAKSRR